MSNILIVEDTTVLHYTLGYALNKNGHSVDIVDRLFSAHDYVQKNDYDVILLDLNMPDGHGLDFLRDLRHDYKINTPVIVMSAAMQKSTVEVLLDAGANDYVMKPFSIPELVFRVNHWSHINVAD